ncbi:MAG: prolyl oligopeptidase family serine peptidase [Burkholderiales bacterium]|nr:prolyl oligopeptidase family serine peptidase [Burkholderiales bacterium]
MTTDPTPQSAPARDTLERGHTRVAGFANAEMDFQLIRQLGAARYGGASIGECLALVRQIDDGVPASWVAAFAASAARQEADAAARAARSHAISARDQYLVACNSYRAAEYYSGVVDPQHIEFGRKSRECFLAAMRLQDDPFEVVSLPFGATPLPAYFLRPAQAPAGSGKTLLIASGYDGTLEETYLAYGRAALERGYRLLLFAGPGQMDTIRFHPGLPFIPDYERVTAAALDHLLARPEVDARRVALMGISFGGYFVTRSAVYDARIRALIANSPITDLHAYMASFAGFDPAAMPDANDIRLEDIGGLPADQVPAQTREAMRNLILRFGCKSFKEAYLRLREFRVDEHELARIRCPALGLVGSGEGAQPIAQFETFVRRIPGAAGHVFTAEEGADGHCQAGNLAHSAAVSLDWLDEVFAT